MVNFLVYSQRQPSCLGFAKAADMKKIYLLVLILVNTQLLLRPACYGQYRMQIVATPIDKAEDIVTPANASVNLLPDFLQVDVDNLAQQTQAEANFLNFYNTLEQLKVKRKSDAWFLEKVFYLTQKEYLHTFGMYEPLSVVLNQKIYNCVSATALYALLLDKLGYTYEVKATPFHCYLVVHAGKRSYLFESTDAVHGFVKDPAIIRHLEAQYLKDAQQGAVKLKMDYTASNLLVSADLKNLCGLLYYNQAVKLYNQQQALQALQALYKANAYYSSPWVASFIDLCLVQVFADTETQEKYWQALGKKAED